MRVLLATDGSHDARRAAEWLAEAPFTVSPTTLAVTVVTLPPSPIDVPTVRAFYAELRTKGLRAAEDACLFLERAGRKAEPRVAEGDPREELLRAIEEWDPDLVLIGARGLGIAGRLLLGSVSGAVARHATCPVLVVRGPVVPDSVLVAVDGSDYSFAAARFVAALPLRWRLMRLVGVVEPAPPMVPVAELVAPPLPPPEVIEPRRRELAVVLERLAADFAGKAGTIERAVVVGSPAREIISAARPGMGMVALGARGLGAFKRILLGSVSEHVLHDAGCPVLIVKGRDPRL